MRTYFFRYVQIGVQQFGTLRAILALPSFVASIPAWRRYNQAQLATLKPEGFDARFGTDTEEMMNLGALGHIVSAPGRARDRVVHDYQTLSADVVEVPLRMSLPPDRKDFVFVDLGCGKGKPLLVASRFPFKRIVGVDISESVIAIARSNIENFGKHEAAASKERFELVVTPVESFVFPKEPLVVYMYNPFPPATMELVLDKLVASLRETRRDVLLMYVAPFRGLIEATSLFSEVPCVSPSGARLMVYATTPTDWAWPRPKTL